MQNDLFDGKGEDRQPTGRSHPEVLASGARPKTQKGILYVIPMLAAVTWFISWPLRAGIARLFDQVLFATDTAHSLYLSTLSVALLALVIVYIHQMYR